MAQTFKQIFVDGPITPDHISRSIQQHQTKYDIGGHSIFLGQVRADQKPEGCVRAIEFTAFDEMALSKAHSIREDIFTKYPLTCMHIYHSLGEVLAGEICLFVFTSSAHRRSAIDACDELVNRIKTELPIWGKEIFADGKSIWKENK